MYELSIIGICATGIYIAYVVLTTLRDIRLRVKMKNKESQLRGAGVTPYGSTLSHGICVDKRTGKFKADQRESLMWYKRLI